MEYEQDSSVTFYSTFVDANGSPAKIISGAITISHRAGSTTKTDVDSAALVQLSGSTYYYIWHIPSGANKTVYNARYVGVDSDGKIGVADEAFQVIPRRFYDKKGGGFVQRVKKDIWTVKEKEELLDMLRSLSEKSEIGRKELRKQLSELSGSLLNISAELKEYVGADLDKIGSSIKSEVDIASDKLGDIIKDIKAKLASQQKIIERYGKLVEEMDSKGTEVNSLVVKELLSLSKGIETVGTDLRNEKISLVISELDDLRKQIDEFRSNLGSEIEDLKEAFVLSIPKEVMEELKNETARINRK